MPFEEIEQGQGTGFIPIPPPLLAPEDKSGFAEIPSVDDPSLAGKALDRVVFEFATIGRDLASGTQARAAGVDLLAANAFMLIDRAADVLSAETLLPKIEAFKRVELYFRGVAASSQEWADHLAGGRTGIASRVNRIVGGLPLDLGTAAIAAGAGGAVKGFAALGALSEADRGPRASAEGAVEGAAIGVFFRGTERFSPTARGGTLAALGTKLGLSRGETVDEAALQGATLGLLGGATAKPQRTRVRALPRAELERVSEPEGVRLLKPEDGKPAEIKAPGEEIVELVPRTEAERTVEKANEFLGRDYSDLELPSHAINLNLDKIKGPADFKRALVELTEVYKNEINDARRGEIKQEQTVKMAEDLGMTVDELLSRQKGAALNAEELTATRMMNKQILDQWFEASKRIQSGRATEQEKAEFLRLTGLAEGSLLSTLGATAESGRAQSSLNIRVGPSAGEMREIREAIGSFRGGKGKNLDDFAALVSTLDTPEGLAGFALNARKATTSDMLMELWINMLLSGPKTQAVNILSNTIVAASAVPESYVAGAIGATRSGVSRARGKGPAEDRVFMREGTARLVGLVEGTREGLVLAGKTFLRGEVSDPATKLEMQRYRSIPGPIGSLIRTPGRALMAGDEFFKSIGGQQEHNALAIRDGLSKGIRSGRELAEHVSEFKQNTPAWALEEIVKNKREQTFTTQLGEQGQGAQKLFARPVGKVIVPFVRVLTNIFKFSARRTPLGLAMKDVRADIKRGGAKSDLALGRMATGSAIAAWVASEAMKGNVTGSGPSDPDLRKMWFAAGYRPYSWRIPRSVADSLGIEGDPNQDAWVSFARLEPWGTIWGVAADYADISGYIERDGADEIAAEIGISISRNVTSKTFLAGISNAAMAASDPARYGKRFAQRLGGTVVPTGLSQLARTKDPILREVRTALDQIKSRIPGYSTTLEARRNWRGDAIITDPGYGPDILSPLYTHRAEPDQSAQEMFRLRIGLRLPGREVQGIELTPKEYTQLQKETGAIAGRAIDALTSAPHYNALRDGMRKVLIEETYTNAKAVGREAALTRISGERLRGAQLEKLAPLLR